MSDVRLETIEKQPGSYYAVGSPLLLEASALYLDKTTNNRVLQMKWRNIDQREINAVMIEVSGSDIFGNISTPVSFQYDGIKVPYGFTFGEKTPVLIKNQKIVKYEVVVKAVSFSDESVWRNEASVPHSALPDTRPQTLRGDLLDQYKRDLALRGYDDAASFLPRKASGLWQCGCGSWQPEGDSCINCGATWSVLSECSNRDTLEEHLAEYKEEQENIRIEAEKEAEEQRRIEEAAQRESEIKRKKATRTFIIGAIVVAIMVAAVLVVTQVVIPDSNYQKAETLRASGNYEEAVKAFQDLGSYKDAPTQVAATYYAEGISKREKSDWSGAVTAFTKAGNYSDAGTQIAATYYAEGEARQLAQEWDAAVTAFQNAGDYSDAATRIKETKYQQASTLEEAGKQEDAKKIFVSLIGYNDSYDRAYKPYYEKGLSLKEAHDWEGATAAFAQAGDYKDAKEQISATRYLEGETKRQNKDWDGALYAFALAGEYSDAKTQILATYYAEGMDKQEAGDWEGARAAFEKAGSYSGAKTQISATYYSEGKEKQEAGDWEGALTAFENAGSYSDAQTQISATYYKNAQAAFAAGDINNARYGYMRSWDYEDSAEQYRMINESYDGLLAVEFGFGVGVRKNGTVVLKGFTFNEDNYNSVISSWRNVKKVYADYDGIIALCHDGTALVAGDKREWMSSVSSFKDIRKIDRGLLLRNDGKVIVTRENTYQNEISQWTDIVDIEVSWWGNYVGLRKDGKVIALGSNSISDCETEEWTNVVMIATCIDGTAGLRTDGTVVFAGVSRGIIERITRWRDIVAIYSADEAIVGIKRDGSVVTTDKTFDSNSYSDFTGIVVAKGGHSAGTIILGMCPDGTVIGMGYNGNQSGSYRWWKDTADWNLLDSSNPESNLPESSNSESSAQQVNTTEVKSDPGWYMSDDGIYAIRPYNTKKSSGGYTISIQLRDEGTKTVLADLDLTFACEDSGVELKKDQAIQDFKKDGNDKYSFTVACDVPLGSTYITATQGYTLTLR